MNLSRIAAVTGLCLMTACDIPTGLPKIDQEWVVPIETTTISVSQLLPAGVSINGTRFAVSVGALSSTQTLGTACGGCGPLNGQTAPVPAFNYTYTTAPTTLPSLVTGADLASGTINVSIQNGFSFDPTSGGGSMTITVTEAGGRALGSAVITGVPAGQITTRAITLAAGTVGASITAKVVIDSKGAAATLINTSQQITVTATPQSVLVNSANVNVANKAFNVDQQNLDVKDIDSGITDHLQEGAIVLDITNPFGVGMTSTIKINYPGGVLSRTITVPATATSSVRLSYTGTELKQFLGKDGVTLTGNGSIVSSAGVITVTPTQTVQLKAKLDAKIQLGS